MINDAAVEAAARAAYGEHYERYRNMMRKALAAALPHLTEGWRPVETAPKDTAVLTYGFGYEVAHFNTAFGRWVACWDHRLIEPPVAWCALPSPPSQEQNR